MSYSSQQDMIDAFGNQEIVELTNLEDVAATTINAIALQQALDDASAIMDGYIGSRYPLPLATPYAPALIPICNDIARYKLDKNRQREDVRKRFEDAIAWLKDLARGLVSLGVNSNNEAPVESANVVYYAPEPIFTRETLRDY